MPNPHYNAGRWFEYRVKKHLEKNGWLVFRQAGSHSPADLVAFKGGEVRFCQCQTDNYFPPAKREQLIEIARQHQCQAWLYWRHEPSKRIVSIHIN